jgi:hypothetical protein
MDRHATLFLALLILFVQLQGWIRASDNVLRGSAAHHSHARKQLDGEPGDEAWIDGIIDEREKSIMDKLIAKRKEKVKERKKEHEINSLGAAADGFVNNCSLPSEAIGVQCATGWVVPRSQQGFTAHVLYTVYPVYEIYTHYYQFF